MKKNILFTVIFGLCSFGCSVNSSKVDDKYAKDFIEKATYVRDKKADNLCYAIVSTRETLHTNQNGVSFTWVACELVEKLLIN